MNPETLFRADLFRSDYHPPLTPQEVAARYDLDPASILKLDSGENPFGPIPEVRAAMGEVDFAWYPDPAYQQLREALGGYVGLPTACIAVSNGADEALDLLIRLCVGSGEAVLDSPPTFPMYATIAKMRGGRVISVPRLADFTLDVPATLAAVERHPAIKIIFACTPNNPTGTVASWPQVSALLATGRLVVVDETYIEFQGRACSLAPLVADIPNLVVVRTFSKWAALAGLRLGFACADPRVAAALMQIKAPYNVNRAAEAAARASLADLPYLDANIATIVAERSRLQKALAHYPFLHPYASAANFIFAETDGPALYETLLQHGIMVRYFAPTVARSAAIRVTVGTPAQNERLLAAIEGVRNWCGSRLLQSHWAKPYTNGEGEVVAGDHPPLARFLRVGSEAPRWQLYQGLSEA